MVVFGLQSNGTEDIWWILEGQDYPRLWWESEQEQNLTADERRWTQIWIKVR